MMWGIICTLDSRGERHQRTLRSVETNCIYTDVLVYKEHQELPTTSRYNLAWNSIRNKISPKDLVMFMADDISIRTKEFDKKAYDTFEENSQLQILYPDDAIQHEALPSHPIFRASFLEVMGEMFPEGYMRHVYCDNYIMDLGTNLNCIQYVPTLKLYHYHPIIGTAPTDEHYQKVYGTEYSEKDRREYQRCCKEHLPKQIEKFHNSAKR